MSGEYSRNEQLKIASGLVISLVIILTITSFVQYTSYRDLLVQNLALRAGQVATTFKSRLSSSDTAPALPDYQKLLNDIARQQAAHGLAVLDFDGHVIAFSGGPYPGQMRAWLDDGLESTGIGLQGIVTNDQG